MITESATKEAYESVKRLRKKHPEDPYWQGALMAYEEVLEIKITDRT